MRVYHSTASTDHDPTSFFRRGRTIAHPESAERYRVLHGSVVAAGFDVREAGDHGLAPLHAVHTAEYIDFVANGWNRRAEIDPAAVELLTTQFARPQMHRRPDGLLGLLGYYTADTSTPLRAGTWSAVYGAVQASISTADAALAEGAAYALCRPPGHHATRSGFGGSCYLNNAAVAAQALRDSGYARVAVVDLDAHHGNGTAAIFYSRADVAYGSVHVDPGAGWFPHFVGFADETGTGGGQGATLNLPVAPGTGDDGWLDTVGRLAAWVGDLHADALVVSLGVDAAADDPESPLLVTADGYAGAGARLAGLGLPTVAVQEGGYHLPSLGRLVAAYLDGAAG
jgi:acetoin utilization deacetylase AcuC-like enzyme